jgi:hypothetical protein
MQIERNFKKNPHTARFLMAFHTAGGTRPTGGAVAVADENQAEIDLAASEDLLDLVPAERPVFRPSAAQVALISKLVLEIHAMDAELGSKAASYTAAMDREGAWTRENTSRWIGNMIKKSRELAMATTKNPGPAPQTTAEVADGRYAVEEGGTLKFFRVKNGRKAGFVFLDVQASDDWHAIRNVTRIREILALIAVDAKAAMVRYGRELGECGHCGKVLTDATSRAAGIGPICRGRM